MWRPVRREANCSTKVDVTEWSSKARAKSINLAIMELTLRGFRGRSTSRSQKVWGLKIGKCRKSFLKCLSVQGKSYFR